MDSNIEPAANAALEKISKKPVPSKSKPGAKSKAKPAQKSSISRTLSKQDRVLTMLQRKDGATVAAIMKTTGWQKHSVHGFLAGVVRKKLRLNLQSKETDGKRIYRVSGGKRTNSSKPDRKAGRKRAR